MNWNEAQKILSKVGADKCMPCVASPACRKLLFDLIQENDVKSVLEIGTYTGITTLTLALAADEVVSVDPRDIGDEPAHRSGILGLHINFVKARSSDYLMSGVGMFDMIFIDGSHEEEDVYSDMVLSLDKLNDGGFMVLHDIFPDDEPVLTKHRRIPGPWRAMQRFLMDHQGISAETIYEYDNDVVRMAVVRP